MQVFEGIPPPYDKQKRMVIPKALRVLRLKPGRRVSLCCIITSVLIRGLLESFTWPFLMPCVCYPLVTLIALYSLSGACVSRPLSHHVAHK